MNSSFMHPRNPYRTPPDFKELALKFPEFRKHAKQVILKILVYKILYLTEDIWLIN